MNITQIKPSTRNASNLIIHKNIVLHIVPEFGTKVVDYIHNMGLPLNTCYSIVVKSGMLKLGGKSFNATKVYLDTKSSIIGEDKKHKSVKIIKTIPKADNISLIDI